MKIRYIFASGLIIESIPHRTTSDQFAENVAEEVNKGDNIIDIQFVI